MATSDTKARTFATRVDIPAADRERLVELLNHSLADSTDLRSQVKQAHWNVKGREFYQLHKLFDEIAEELDEFVDEIAERATALGGYATGTIRMAVEHTSLPEFPADAIEDLDCVEAVAERLGLYANRIRRSIDEADGLGDKSTADLYTEISRVADKRLWFLEAHLQRGRG